jgi:O-antigen/teichoic acid export membrane protein
MKNTFIILFGSIVRMVSSFVLVVLVARYLGKAGMGEFSFLVSLFWLFQTIALLGIQPLITREVAKNLSKTNEFLVNGFWIGGVSAILMMIVMILYVVLAGYSHDLQLAAVYMSIALVWTTLSLVFQSVFIAHGRTDWMLWSTVAENVVKLILGLWALEVGLGVVTLSLIMGMTPLINVIFNYHFYIKHIGRIHYKMNKAVCMWMLKLVPTFAGISIFGAIFNNVSMLVLSKTRTMEEVGVYGAALRLIAVMSTILQSYKSAIQPAAAQTFETHHKHFGMFCSKSIRLILMITIPIALGTTVLSKRIIQLLFGPAFADSAPILTILMWSIVPYGGMMVFASFIISSNNQKVDLKVNALSTLAALILSFALIPPLGAIGAAIATLLSTLVFLSLQIVFIQKHLFHLDWFQVGWKIFTAGILMGAALKIGKMPLGVEIALGVVVYFVFLALLKEPSIHEFKFSQLRPSTLKGSE